MEKDCEKQLTKQGAADIMLLRMNWKARHIKYGALELYGLAKNNGVVVLQVMDGKIVQCDLEIRPIERFRAE